MSESTRNHSAAGIRCSGLVQRNRQSGLSLIELMVAMILGLLVSAGIVALFMATNRSSSTQNALGRVQENGRFATGRIEADLRMAGALFRQSSVAERENWAAGSQGAMLPRTAIMIHASGVILRGLGAETGRLGSWSTTEPYPVSAAYFVRGYECSSGTCSPAVPTGANGVPAVGTAAGNRVRGTDVLTMSYMRGVGWKYELSAAGPGTPTGNNARLTIEPGSAGAGVTSNFVSGDLVLVSDCSGTPSVFRANVAGNVLTPTGLFAGFETSFRPGAGNGTCDARLFNFSRDFVTVSYWLQLAADPNPAAAGRRISTLMRWENGVAQEIAQGVERLDFLYGVTHATNGGMAYFDAGQILANSNAANCSPPAGAFSRTYSRLGPNSAWREPACLWRSLRSIEVHALFNTVDDMGAMAAQDMAYWYAPDNTSEPVIPSGTMPVTGLTVGRMMRREFMTLVSIRNGSI
ncbi:MAG: prepilin-type N-terminal cleavage/methylation domain-containing protein [Rhodanobacteraceae bacterium]|nr:prepilin-type N-terminal cleavage/methylation domain-containing protein [Rhodanobacteraceae bacterium]